MKKNRIVVTVGCMCASMLIAGVSPINAANKVEIDSAVAGISVAMNNFYAGSANPEEEIKGYLENSETAPAAKTKAAAEEASPYENLAVSRVGDDEGYVNIRTDANTDSEVVGKIYNNCAATIEETVSGEDGDWYKIKSGSVEGYIKSDYFVTGDEALDKEFIAAADKAGFKNLKGHRTVGGMRASIYNAMPLEGVEKLVAFMKAFEAAH